MPASGPERLAIDLLCALLGLLVGSFLNVVVWRVPRGESVVQPGSHCPRCDNPIRAWQNVPVFSYLLLRGRCRHCRASISWRYPLVETLTAALFAVMAWRFGPHAVLPAFLYLSAIAVALALIDLDTRKLPNVIVLPSYLVAAVLLGAAALTGAHPLTVASRAVAAMAACYGFYALAAFAKPGGIGWGDVKLAGVLGLYLGYLGWGSVAVGMFAAVLLGTIVGVALLVGGRASRRSAIPYGPFLLAGTLLASLDGQSIFHGYLHLFHA